MTMTHRVLGVDLASTSWKNIGSALVTFDRSRFLSAATGLVSWPLTTLNPVGAARAIDGFARANAIDAVSIDGPQGWRDPDAPPERPGVGRASEYATKAPGKTGTRGVSYPGTYLKWIEFSIDVFAELLDLAHVELANDTKTMGPISAGRYWLLECFPTSTWRHSGLDPLPAKGKCSAATVEAHARRLQSTYGLPTDALTRNHDDLQALVAALPAVGLLGGPAKPCPHGEPARRSNGVLVEGIIWDAGPVS